MTKQDVLGIAVFASLVLGLIALRVWGTGVLRDADGMLLVFCACAGWLGFAAFLVDGSGEDARARGCR